MMRLGDVAPMADAEVMRDGAFESLGFVSHRYERMLVFLEDSRFLAETLSNPGVSCVLTSSALASSVPTQFGLMISANPRVGFYRLHNHLVLQTEFYGSPFPTEVADSARIHPSAIVAEQGVEIRDRVVIEANVTILSRVTIGEDAVIGPGTVLGSGGFQSFMHEGKPYRVAHGGSVRIGRGVDLHANICVDRALFGSTTTIGDDSVIDNLVYVAHDANIGSGCRIGAGSQVTGSVRVGSRVWIGPGATISSGVQIGDDAAVSLGSVVTQNVTAGSRVSGNFAIPHDRFLEQMRRIR